MSITHSRLSVLFEAPFWIALYERETDGKYEVCKVTFGAEPKDYEVWEYVLKHFRHLSFSPAVEAPYRERAMNPKRAKRDADRRLAGEGIGTRSQRALSAGREAVKAERSGQRREEREAHRERLFELRQQKRKEKKRGR